MEYKIQKLYDQVNQAIIRCRGVYSMWAKNNNVSYNRMLVLYTIREFGFCTQKQICDSYLLPRQTVNHVISEMKKDGILDALPVGEQDILLETIIQGSAIVNPKEMAHHILEQVMAWTGREPADDMTVIVVGMWEICDRNTLQARMDSV